jgi:hypothetical protein
MIKFQAHTLIRAINSLSTAEAIIGGPIGLEEGTKKALQTNVETLIQEVQLLSLPMSLKKAKNLHFYLTQDPSDRRGYLPLLTKTMAELRERLQDELDSKAIYVITSHAQYLEPTLPPFGEAVYASFPSCYYDVEEAGRCLALDRSTACVTHLMRVLEIGLGVLASSLAVQFAHSNWGTIIDQIEKAIKEVSKKTHGDDWKQDQKFFSEAATHFRMLKDAWRNHAMHARERYSPDQAEVIFISVRAFMQQLATRLSEKARPKPAH